MKDLKKIIEEVMKDEQMEDLSDMQYKWAVSEEYIKKDINNFAEYINKDDDWKIDTDSEDVEYATKLSKIVRQLTLIETLCYTKKIEHNRQDFKDLAKCLKGVSDLMIDLSKTKSTTKKETKTSKEMLQELIEQLFE
mgnify:CR=1 FL=1